jgi:1,4-alpha-glucan branching enzyme
LNTDAAEYGGVGWGNFGGVQSVPVGAHGRTDSINLNLPPLSTIVLRWDGYG